MAFCSGIVNCCQTSDYERKMDLIPGPKTVPIFGNALQLEKDPTARWKQMTNFCLKYEEDQSAVFKLKVMSKTVVIASQVDTLENLLKSTVNINKPSTYMFFQPMLLDGIFLNAGSVWNSRRPILAAAYQSGDISDVIKVTNEHAAVLVQQLVEQGDKDPLDMIINSKLCALDVMFEIATGIKLDAQGTRGNVGYYKSCCNLAELIIARGSTPLHWNDTIYSWTENGKEYAASTQLLHVITQKLIDDRMAELDGTSPTEAEDKSAVDPPVRGEHMKIPILDAFIQLAKENPEFKTSEILQELTTFIAGGHYNFYLTVAWAMQHIGMFRDVQTKLHAEMDEIFGDTDRTANMDDLAKMTYLDCVIKETMRLFPGVPSIGRKLSEDVDLGGVTVPKGADVTLLIWRIHRDAKHWPSPDKFDPERFTPINSVGHHPYSYLPNSLGPRACLGNKYIFPVIKSLVSAMLRRFQVEATQTIEETVPVPLIFMLPQNGIKIKFSIRHR